MPLLNTPPTRPAPVLKLTLPRLGIVAPAGSRGQATGMTEVKLIHATI
ncbi:MAG: hypothetical protein AB8U82_00885 [Rickettsia endosymbiont of Haemaphysalis japonica]